MDDNSLLIEQEGDEGSARVREAEGQRRVVEKKPLFHARGSLHAARLLRVLG